MDLKNTLVSETSPVPLTLHWGEICYIYIVSVVSQMSTGETKSHVENIQNTRTKNRKYRALFLLCNGLNRRVVPVVQRVFFRDGFPARHLRRWLLSNGSVSFQRWSRLNREAATGLRVSESVNRLQSQLK